MTIDQVINVINGDLNVSRLSLGLFWIAFIITVIALITFFRNETSGYGLVLLFIAVSLIAFSIKNDSDINHYPDDAVKSYIKSLDESKVILSEIVSDHIKILELESTNGVDYVRVTIDSSAQNLGVFKTTMKVVYDVKDGEDSYITYKKLKKTLPGYYKKGWVKATLHVERGTDLMDLDKYVDGNIGSQDVVTNDDQACGESSKYVFVKEKGKLTIVCVGKSFDVDNVFKGQTGEVLTYTSFKDAKEWLVKNIKEDKIDNSVLDTKELKENESYYK